MFRAAGHPQLRGPPTALCQATNAHGPRAAATVAIPVRPLGDAGPWQPYNFRHYHIYCLPRDSAAVIRTRADSFAAPSL